MIQILLSFSHGFSGFGSACRVVGVDAYSKPDTRWLSSDFYGACRATSAKHLLTTINAFKAKDEPSHLYLVATGSLLLSGYLGTCQADGA